MQCLDKGETKRILNERTSTCENGFCGKASVPIETQVIPWLWKSLCGEHRPVLSSKKLGLSYRPSNDHYRRKREL